jgi:pyridoxamine 5'-phosphate oxidase
MNISDIRKEYTLQTLDINSVKINPIAQFNDWFADALNAEMLEPTAMHLATVSAEGKPSGRVVLLKGVDTGFLFFTNYESRKGKEMAMNPFACLTFFWAELERQVRIEGKIEKVTAEISDSYFQSRPPKSQIGAIVSPQSQVIEHRDFLEQQMQVLEKQYENKLPLRPAHWGGYRLVPHIIEFWQGRRSRLHDRVRYTQMGSGGDSTQQEHDGLGHWKIERLAP